MEKDQEVNQKDDQFLPSDRNRMSLSIAHQTDFRVPLSRQQGYLGITGKGWHFGPDWFYIKIVFFFFFCLDKETGGDKMKLSDLPSSWYWAPLGCAKHRGILSLVSPYRATQIVRIQGRWLCTYWLWKGRSQLIQLSPQMGNRIK